MFENHTKGKVIKSVTYSFGTIANGVTSSTGNIATLGDDQKARHIIGIESSDHTANAHTYLQYANKTVVDIDDSCFSGTLGPIDMDITYPVGVYLQLAMLNSSGGSITGVDVTVFYEVDSI